MIDLEKIEAEVQERERLVREILGKDFPMLDWYIKHYAGYYRNIKTIEAINLASQKEIYVITIGQMISVALIAPAGTNIEEVSRGYPQFVDEKDAYGLILYLINECGFEMARNAYTLDTNAVLQSIEQNKYVENLSNGIPFEDKENEYEVFLNSLSAEHILIFQEMMRKTQLIDYQESMDKLSEKDKALLDKHNKEVDKSMELLKKSMGNKNKPPIETNPTTAYAHDGYKMGQDCVVILSGYPDGEFNHRYVAIGNQSEIESIKNSIEEALRNNKRNIPYCGKITSAKKWLVMPKIHIFKTIQEARKFAAMYDPQFSDDGYILQ